MRLIKIFFHKISCSDELARSKLDGIEAQLIFEEFYQGIQNKKLIARRVLVQLKTNKAQVYS